ncbi:hypothetical protein BDZ89DRAFT_1158115 [Hymenopellis radicata]|nr:hypothetical protein BDZ89DRAFT_1158115 [Hymenopellis radicata]
MRSINVIYVLLAVTLASKAAPAAESSGELARSEDLSNAQLAQRGTCDLSSPQVGCRLDLEALSTHHAPRELDARRSRIGLGDITNIFDIIGDGVGMWKDHKDSEAAQASPQSQSQPDPASQVSPPPSQPSVQPQRRGPESKTCNISALTPGCELDLSNLSNLHSTRNLDGRGIHIPDFDKIGDIINIGKEGIHLFDNYIGKDKGEDAAQESTQQQSQPANQRRSKYCDPANPIPGCVFEFPSMRRGLDIHDFHPGHWVWDETKKAAHFIDNNLGMDSHDDSGSTLDGRDFKDFINGAWDKVKDGAHYVDNTWGMDKGKDEAQNADVN